MPNGHASERRPIRHFAMVISVDAHAQQFKNGIIKDWGIA
jgi:hypothetical protein